jgi:hypothetical protein
LAVLLFNRPGAGARRFYHFQPLFSRWRRGRLNGTSKIFNNGGKNPFFSLFIFLYF